MRYKEYAARFRRAWDKSEAPKVQKELAKWLGFSQPTVSDWLNGVKLPSMDTALKLCDKFDIDPVWLLTGKGGMRSGEESTDPLYKEFLSLSSEQRSAVELMIKMLNKTQNTEQTPLTAETENVGGGGLISRQKSAEPQYYSGTAPLQDSIAATKRLQLMASREQEAARSYICGAERRAIERRVDAVMRTNKAPLNWQDLHSSFTARAPQDDDELPRQSE